jgi:hypothetical protein
MPRQKASNQPNTGASPDERGAKPLSGHGDNASRAADGGSAPHFEPLSGALDVDEEALIGKVDEDREQLGAGVPTPS